jgi:hypothetical protein
VTGNRDRPRVIGTVSLVSLPLIGTATACNTSVTITAGQWKNVGDLTRDRKDPRG